MMKGVEDQWPNILSAPSFLQSLIHSLTGVKIDLNEPPPCLSSAVGN